MPTKCPYNFLRDPEQWDLLRSRLQSLAYNPNLAGFLNIIRDFGENGSGMDLLEDVLGDRPKAEQRQLIQLVSNSASKVPESFRDGIITQLKPPQPQRQEEDHKIIISLEEQLFLLSHMLFCTIR